mgnify:CR=1 FL=1
MPNKLYRLIIRTCTVKWDITPYWHILHLCTAILYFIDKPPSALEEIAVSQRSDKAQKPKRKRNKKKHQNVADRFSESQEMECEQAPAEEQVSRQAPAAPVTQNEQPATPAEQPVDQATGSENVVKPVQAGAHSSRQAEPQRGYRDRQPNNRSNSGERFSLRSPGE